MDLGPHDFQMITSMASLAMALVWIIYLHLVLVQYRRAQRPYLIIQHAHENDPTALCMFVNMSKESVDLQCVLAQVPGTGGRMDHYVTDYDRITPDDRNVQSRLRNGPTQPGSYLVRGSFEDILRGQPMEGKRLRQKKETKQALLSIYSMQVCIAVVHSPSRHLVGARRQFYIEHEDRKVIIRAHSIHTEQPFSWAKRRIVRRWIEERVDPKFQVCSESRPTDQSAQSYGAVSGKFRMRHEAGAALRVPALWKVPGTHPAG